MLVNHDAEKRRKYNPVEPSDPFQGQVPHARTRGGNKVIPPHVLGKGEKLVWVRQSSPLKGKWPASEGQQVHSLKDG